MSFCDTKWLRRWSGVVLLVYLTALITGRRVQRRVAIKHANPKYAPKCSHLSLPFSEIKSSGCGRCVPVIDAVASFLSAG